MLALKQSIAVIGGCNAVGFALSAAFETHKLTDLVGVGSFVAASIHYSYTNGLLKFIVSNPTKIFRNLPLLHLTLINLGVIFWGTRLSTYLFGRVLAVGEDKRLDKFYKEKDEKYLDYNKSFYPLKLGFFWSIQALWGIIGMLPITFLNSIPRVESLIQHTKFIDSNQIIKLLGFSLNQGILSKILLFLPISGIVTGLIIETIADYQKNKYRKNIENKNHWCDVGLWSLSKYPNCKFFFILLNMNSFI
jgi:steroid 5-alpha reductase family enzyme